MFNVQNNLTFYLFDYDKQYFTHIFLSEEDLIMFLVNQTKCEWWSKDPYNPYFEDINMTGNDTNHYFSMSEKEWQIRPYLFVDSKDRILDVRKYKEKVYRRFKNEQKKMVSCHNQTERKFQYGDILYSWDGTPYRYRIDPVPCIYRRFHYYGIRHMKTTQELREISDVEYGKYTRSKRKLIPTCYDDVPRHTQRSWKEQSKKRKQWM